MTPTPPSNQQTGGFRLSGLVLTGIIILALLFGLLLGALLGGVGGFLAGRNNAQASAALLPITSPASSSPSGLAGGASDSTQPGAGSSRQTPSNGNTMPTQPNGSNPQAQPGGTNPQAPFGGRGSRQTPGNNTTPTQPDGSNPQAQPTLGVYLGIRYTTLTPDVASQLGVTDVQGAVVGEVVSGSPAAKAGLQPMDVATAVDGKPLSDTYTLIDALSGHKPGDKVQFTVWRMGQSETIEVTLGAPAG